jgi:hypothetical protein
MADADLNLKYGVFNCDLASPVEGSQVVGRALHINC